MFDWSAMIGPWLLGHHRVSRFMHWRYRSKRLVIEVHRQTAHSLLDEIELVMPQIILDGTTLHRIICFSVFQEFMPRSFGVRGHVWWLFSLGGNVKQMWAVPTNSPSISKSLFHLLALWREGSGQRNESHDEYKGMGVVKTDLECPLMTKWICCAWESPNIQVGTRRLWSKH